MIPDTLEKALLKQIQELPDEAIKQLIDFAHFLRYKQLYAGADITTELKQLNSKQTSHLEEELTDYQATYPRESE